MELPAGLLAAAEALAEALAEVADGGDAAPVAARVGAGFAISWAWASAPTPRRSLFQTLVGVTVDQKSQPTLPMPSVAGEQGP